MLARDSCQTGRVSDRHARLQNGCLYLACGEQPDEFLEAALRGGVDIVQLRIKDCDDERVLAAAERYRRICDHAGALLIVNDRPDLALAGGADGVHIGQDDVSAQDARQTMGDELIVGLSTHSPEQVSAAQESGVDYIGVGPVYATPTKPGRPAVGLELVGYAARNSRLPFFAIGGIDAGNVDAVRRAGARRIAVVRALTQAVDPGVVARELRSGITNAEGVGVGAT